MTTRDLRGLIEKAKSKVEDVCRKAEYVFMINTAEGPKYSPCLDGEEGAFKRGGVLLEHMQPPKMRFDHLSPRISQGQQPLETHGKSSGWRRNMQLTDEERSRLAGNVSDKKEMTDDQYREWMLKNP